MRKEPRYGRCWARSDDPSGGRCGRGWMNTRWVPTPCPRLCGTPSRTCCSRTPTLPVPISGCGCRQAEAAARRSSTATARSRSPPSTAKGLEWPTVIVVGAVPGLVPHSSARRHGPSTRNGGCSTSRTRVRSATSSSPGTATRARRGWPRSTRRPRPRPRRRPLDRSPAPARPDPVVQGLYAWRRQAARAARVDETTVLDDRTLAAIVAADPSTIDELADVPGFGPLMARRHGPRILAALAAGRRAPPRPCRRPDPTGADPAMPSGPVEVDDQGRGPTAAGPCGRCDR